MDIPVDAVQSLLGYAAGHEDRQSNARHMKSYFSTPLSADPSLSQQLRLLRAVFALTFASVLIVHVFLPVEQPLSDLLIHACAIALAYSASVVLLSGIVYGLRNLVGVDDRIAVWHVWLMSFTGYVFGYFLSPFETVLFILG